MKNVLPLHPRKENLNNKMKHIWKATAFMMAAFTITSCNDNKFTVEGQINNAKDSVLYFENVGLEGIQILDSVKLNDNGDFSFSEAANLAPEFYRLSRVDAYVDNLVGDSETVEFWCQVCGFAK